MAITKNRQSRETIRAMALRAFGNKELETVIELTEGMCNTAYLVTFKDGSRSVLKIASADERGRMSNEVGLMETEVTAMRLVSKSGAVKVAEVFYYDTSKELCDGAYFFMEVLDGKSYSSMGDELTEEEKKVLNYEIGQAERKITSICGTHFGFLVMGGKIYQDLFSFVYLLISNVLDDAQKMQVDTVIAPEAILLALERDKGIFEEVTQPRLVHWDMWEGNIFVKDKHISGIIDWERAMWGDALMDDRFRRHSRNAEFLKGFGQETFSEQEMRRIFWYDVLLYLTMMTEGAYREYEDDGVYQWAKIQLNETWSELMD